MKKLTRKQVIKKLKKGDEDFSHLDLRGLDLSKQDLSGCNFSYAILDNANLELSNLSDCNLSFTNMAFSNLGGADLRNANLYFTELGFTYLEGANFSGATLKQTCMRGATLVGTIFDENEKIRKGVILKEKMIGYKKCKDEVIVILEIPKGAIVFSINNDMCRTNKAKVIEISNGKTIAKSRRNNNFIYELGKEIEIEDFDLTYNLDCTSGIHFFRTIEEAQKW